MNTAPRDTHTAPHRQAPAAAASEADSRKATLLVANLRAGILAALTFSLCQVVIETVSLGLRFRDQLLIPLPMFGALPFDFGVKLLFWFPATKWLVIDSAADRFFSVGISPKLAAQGTLLIAALIAGMALAVFIATARCWRGHPIGAGAVVNRLALCALAVHLAVLTQVYDRPDGFGLSDLWMSYEPTHFSVRETLFALLVLALATGASHLVLRRRPRQRWLWGAAAAIVLGAGAFSPAVENDRSYTALTDAPSRVPGPAVVDNIVLISIDSLRADRLGGYGHARDTSPTIDRLAEQGTRFANVTTTSSWTLPAHMSMLTGRDAFAHGVNTERDTLPPGVPTLAEELRRAGFVTRGIVAENSVMAGWRGFARGFELYDDKTVSDASGELNGETAPLLTSLAIAQISEMRRHRFFLFLHYWDVHYDYVPPKPYDSLFDPAYDGPITGVGFVDNDAVDANISARDLEHVLALYDGEIRWVDDHIAEILMTLDELGLAERTAVIVTADHGDEFFEHGGKGHGRTLYREVMHVPLVVRVPGMPSGNVVEAPVSVTDIMPTILDLAGVSASAAGNGLSLAPLLAGRVAALHELTFASRCFSFAPGCYAMRQSKEGTLILGFWPFGVPLSVEFYGPSDVLQQKTIADELGPRRDEEITTFVAELNVRWKQFRAAGGRVGTAELDAETRERLRALGYMP